jgi:hypothetical protein
MLPVKKLGQQAVCGTQKIIALPVFYPRIFLANFAGVRNSKHWQQAMGGIAKVCL